MSMKPVGPSMSKLIGSMRPETGSKPSRTDTNMMSSKPHQNIGIE